MATATARESKTSQRAARPASEVGQPAPARVSSNSVWQRLATGLGPLQAKLRVGAVDDPLEREADRVADAVVSGSMSGSLPGSAAGTVQRKCAACEEEEKLQTKREAGPGGSTPEVSPTTASRIASFRGGGEALSPAARSYFEPRFGRDLSAVRLHTGGEAATAAQEVQARAFTVGSDIAFAAGEYRPESQEGRKLLAHELTHAVQQRSVGNGGPGAETPFVRRYRSKKAANFKACDTNTLVEKTFADKDKDPWIEKITVNFDGTTTDTDGDLIPTGKLGATYFANTAALPPLTGVAIVGGKASAGLTDTVTDKEVERIEGCGYNQTAVTDPAERVKGHPKYFIPSLAGNANMSFAVFFKQTQASGNQAIHEGLMSSGSLGCVHVGTTSTIQQINYHSREGVTKVTVSYGASALKTACCERKKTKGFMVNNPCKGQDPKKCP